MVNRQRVEPKPGQESVWDYPRPPRLESSSRHIQVVFNGEVIADTTNALRMLETSHPPVYYVPAEDVQQQYLTPTNHQTFCEWKGKARYYTLIVTDQKAVNAVWDYPNPSARYAEIKNHFAVYPAKMDACYVDQEPVQAQAGDFYGGWITSDIVGPFKGEPGSWGW